MNDIIENLLRKQEPAKRFCIVVKPLGTDRYQVRDSQGHLMAVDADRLWKAGQGVRVAQERIVGGAAKIQQPEEIEV